jgi:SNF2 family DNA or RNA helicase
MAKKSNSVNSTSISANLKQPEPYNFVFEDFNFNEIKTRLLSDFGDLKLKAWDFNPYVGVDKLNINHGIFRNTIGLKDKEVVEVKYEQEGNKLTLRCKCATLKQRMCPHQTGMLYALQSNKQVRIFFDPVLRKKEMLNEAERYGLEGENLDDFFTLEMDGFNSKIVPKNPDIFSFDEGTIRELNQGLLPGTEIPKLPQIKNKKAQKGLAFSRSKYTNNFFIYPFEADISKDGKPKNPLHELNVVSEMEDQSEVDALRFFAALGMFKDRYDNDSSFESRLKAMRRIAKNTPKLALYHHDPVISENINARALVPLEEIVTEKTYLSFYVREKRPFYEIEAFVHFPKQNKLELKRIRLRYDFLFYHQNKYYLLDNPFYVKVFKFFQNNQFSIKLHQSKFQNFKETYLDVIDKHVEIQYSFVKQASNKQIEAAHLDEEVQKTIYLEESENYILLTPTVRYGNVEVPILSLKGIYDFDKNGEMFSFERDKFLENQFAGILVRQHESFEEQLGQFEHFYMHKQEFLESGWFIDAFQAWRETGVEVLGFNELKGNLISDQKMTVSTTVSSGIDWFETGIKVNFGNEEIALKQVQKAIKNKSRFIPLGDGKQGLMPQDWIERFSKYFRSGDIVDGKIRVSKLNFSVIEELYEQEVLSQEVSHELVMMKNKINSFKDIVEVPVPKKLQAELRDYQKKGLNWLNFLDEYRFGGCLADDMGLGKTIQVLAFLLLRKAKNKKATHLIIVPTSLIFNWQREIEKFAPSLKIYTLHGTSRTKKIELLEKHDIVLTTYGTMMSDVRFLKEFAFDYIVLDESQAIKNPASQRYKAARLLQSYNKLILSGTPIENNTFDLYAQFSFINPGLFINQSRFKEEYAVPIDKFKDIQRAQELQKRINPFLLRRTKKQVAKELPEKTEMVLYCEMGEEQKKVYDVFKNDIRTKLKAPKQQEIPEQKSMLILTGLTKLRQICNSPAILNEEADYGEESAKLDVLMKEIDSKVGRHKILVFSQFVSMLNLIRTELDKREISHEYLTGQTMNREEKVHRFQNDEEVRVFLISLKAGGTGLNLTEADYVYLVDPWWNPAVENQAIDRCYRIGQKKNVVAVRLITPDSIEEKIMDLQANKKELAEDLIQTDTSILKSLNENDILNLFE